MGYFLIGIIVLSLGLLFLKQLTTASVADLARGVRRWGGVLVILFAGFMAATGRWVFAIPIAGFGYSMLRGRMPGFGGFSRGGSRTRGQTSSVKSHFLEMLLEHDSGDMYGKILEGDFKGAALEELSLGELLDFMQEISGDEESSALLQTYMDRRFPGWREEEQQEERSTGGSPRRGALQRNEALAILGLKPGASPADIRKAHRTLMKKLHPDQGGSTYFATKLNEARDLLL
jgi:DnaJ-domain-containing protein 1